MDVADPSGSCRHNSVMQASSSICFGTAEPGERLVQPRPDAIEQSESLLQASWWRTFESDVTVCPSRIDNRKKPFV